MVFVRSADEDRCGGFTQPLLLCLVTGIEGEGDADESIDHDDVLSVQYMTAPKYTANYTPAIMADADSRANKCKKNSVWTGSIARGNVAIVNVGFTSKKKVPTAFPSTIRGRVPKQFTYKLDKKSKSILQANEDAKYDDHK